MFIVLVHRYMIISVPSAAMKQGYWLGLSLWDKPVAHSPGLDLDKPRAVAYPFALLAINLMFQA